MNAPLLEVQNLEVVFDSGAGLGRSNRGLVAVAHVSFTIFEEETLGLMGESGCGKTTVGRSIIGLVRPESGRILFEGKVLSKLSAKELRATRRRLQMIFQDTSGSLNP